MANRERGEVAIEAGGKTYTLVLGTNAMCELEELLSTPDRRVTTFQVANDLGKGDIRYVRALVWAALRKHHKDMTLSDAAELIDEFGGLLSFSPKLKELIESTKPDPADRQKRSDNDRPTEARPAKAGTGPSSIARHDKSA